jgi:hypothetical protein
MFTCVFVNGSCVARKTALAFKDMILSIILPTKMSLDSARFCPFLEQNFNALPGGISPEKTT